MYVFISYINILKGDFVNNFIITVFISTCIMFFSTTNLLIYPVKTKYKLFIFIILFLCGYFKFQNGQSGSYLVLIILFISILLFSKNKCKFINICTSLLGYVCLVFINQLALIFIEYMFDIKYQLLENSNYGLLFSIIFFIFIYLISFFTGKIMRKKIDTKNLIISKKTSILILSTLLICTFIFISNFVLGEKIGYSYSVIRYNAILFGSFFFITLTLLYSIVYTIKKEQKTRFEADLYSGLQPYMSQLEQLYQETKEFRHDYTNILYTLYDYIKEGNLQNLENYYVNNIYIKHNPFQNPTFELGKLSNIKILEIKSIVYIKMIQALTKNIHLYINIPLPIMHVSIDTIDLSQILGIFLDNAIEASIISEKKEIEFCFEKHLNSYSIIVKNSCKDNQINFSQLNTLGYSTKGENRGIGLHNVKKILVLYPNVQHTTLFENYYFTQKLEDL